MYSFLGKGVFALILCLHILLKAYSKVSLITNQLQKPFITPVKVEGIKVCATVSLFGRLVD